VQLYRYFVSQSSEFCHHNPLCCFWMSVCCLFRYQLSPETFGYTLVHTRCAIPASARSTSQTNFWNHQHLPCCVVFSCSHIIKSFAFQGFLSLGSRRKSQVAISDELGCFLACRILCSPKNCYMNWAQWSGALSWWRFPLLWLFHMWSSMETSQHL
jgi:hypothetical protein